MKNYLLYLDCYTEDQINESCFSLLKFLGVYNLTPPANIRVIVYTSRPSRFEIFLTYFKNMQVIQSLTGDKNQGSVQQKISGYEGNLLFCSSFCYSQKPIDDLFEKINSGSLVVLRQRETNKIPDTSVMGINSERKDRVIQAKNPAALNIAGGYANDQIIEAGNYFINYNGVPEVTKLLKLFFKKNEEESVPNLVKIAHHIDATLIQKEAQALTMLPLIQKWFNFITGKNSIIQRYQNKL